MQDWSETEVFPEHLVDALKVQRSQGLAILKELGEAGYGQYVVGRRGGQTRLLRAASPDEGRHSHPYTTIEAQVPLVTTQAPQDLGTFQTFLLMRSPPVPVEVPANLTRAEAEKLSKWLLLISDTDD